MTPSLLRRLRRSRQRFMVALVLLMMATLIFLMTYTSQVSNPSKLLLSNADFSSKRGCVMPRLKKYNDYRKYGHSERVPEPVECDEEADWLEVSNGVISFSQEALKKYKGNIKCNINFMKRIDDFNQTKKYPTLFLDSSTGHKTLPLEDDFLYANCRTKSGVKRKWNNILAGISIKQEVLHRKNRDFTPSIVSVAQDKPKPMNVLVFGFDSVSHVYFMRKLPKLYSYLVNDLDATVLNNHNIVGDGTMHNLIGIFTGRYETELPNARQGVTNETLDNYPFIFKEFKNNRYTTAYAEEQPHIGTFQRILNGFQDEPTDHCMRPFQLQAQQDLEKHLRYCIGSKPMINILMNWLEEVFKVYPSDVGKFIFGFLSLYSHDIIEELVLADDPVTEWIQGLKDSGKLNNTVLMVMSDHGHRFSFARASLQGKYEERLPFFSIILPEWFKNKFPNSYRALQMNAADRLTSHFDIHETFKTILYQINQGIDVGSVAHDKNNMTQGMSLFREIPLERSCEDAKISKHWCACNTWITVEPKMDKLVGRAAKSIVDNINQLVEEADHQNKCQTLRISSIKRSQKMIPKKELLTFKKSGYRMVPIFSDNTTVSQHVPVTLT